jgi:hypothetical protein
MNLIYIHIGKELVNCLIDSIYQTLLVNGFDTHIYVILSDQLIIKFKSLLKGLSLKYYNKVFSNTNYENLVTVVPISILELSLINDASSTYINYKSIVNKYALSSFRDSFWIHTTCRFFYIHEFAKIFLKGQRNFFHIENDIMLYENLKNLGKKIYDTDNESRTDTPRHSENFIYMVKDSPKRVIPGILCFSSPSALETLTKFITHSLKKSQTFINDMELLANYPMLKELPFNPCKNNNTNDNGSNGPNGFIFDGACIGQYLGGVDPRNIGGTGSDKELLTIDNPSRGFVNETCDFKISDCIITKRYDYPGATCCVKCSDGIKLKKYFIGPIGPIGPEEDKEAQIDKQKDSQIVNLHVHSKQLYQFSSIFDINYKDIITGDRVVELCDLIITTKDIDNFHKGIEHLDARKVFLDSEAIIIPIIPVNGTLKFFVYSHILDTFVALLQAIKESLKQYKNCEGLKKIVIYSHNSDHSFEEKHYQAIKEIANETGINFDIFAQGVNCKPECYVPRKSLDESPKIYDKVRVTLLPIGIANKMWPHGSLETLYDTMSKNYKKIKSKNIYICVNCDTYPYRKTVIDKMQSLGYTIQDPIKDPKIFNDYLKELSEHYFSLCIRGNGIDTHRFWESLYLGTIPVIINNKETDCKNFVEFLYKLFNDRVRPFIVIKDLEELSKGYFSEELYLKIITSGRSIWCMDQLKIDYYK